ncbi:hypothetical protein SH584_09030 [Sphingomonas sp. LY29]|uniref:hypothetical protein n=1 Tax=Sphingomonas sp. LY29 TaxID=3095341 RepID=UPI002D78B89F|nr:hypothetical protein [Sphingomonas sp. LY29]WRP25188.1 hypothetical protein SH584_09030 [Sphingomonas sp. LY29]
MASPLPTGKQSVNLASTAVPGSRIRRDPPKPEKVKIVVDPESRDQFDAIVGITAFALAIAVILLGVALYGGWSPSQYTLEI